MKRFYLPAALTPGAAVPLPPALTHRLRHVLRMQPGQALHVFNSTGDLATATVADAKCRTLRIEAMLPAAAPLPPLTLALGLPKREAWETALRQATELGATAIVPLKTQFAQVAKLNLERAQAILIEAAEQSERTTLPTLAPLTPLPLFLETLAHPCAWAYERATIPSTLPLPAPNTALIGPEGGFSPDEISTLQHHPHIVPISLGPTILRTDTAVVAALSRLQGAH